MQFIVRTGLALCRLIYQLDLRLSDNVWGKPLFPPLISHHFPDQNRHQFGVQYTGIQTNPFEFQVETQLHVHPPKYGTIGSDPPAHGLQIARIGCEDTADHSCAA